MIFRCIYRFCFCFVSQHEFEKLIVVPFLCIIILKKRYDKKKKWYRLKDVNLTINSGRLVAIMGVSGAGKSTLFDAILKRLKLDWDMYRNFLYLEKGILFKRLWNFTLVRN